MEDLPKQLESVTKGQRLKHFPKGQIILYEGDKLADIYILSRGVVRVYDIDESGNEKILHLLKPPAVVPLAFFSGPGAKLKWFYSALNDCDAFSLERVWLYKQMSANAPLAIYLMNWFSLEVHELLVRLSSMGKTNAHDKVVAALKFLAKYHSAPRRSGWQRVGFSVNQQLIADLTGVTRESAATIMRDLQLKGIIRNPRLTILEISFDKLVKLDSETD